MTGEIRGRHVLYALLAFFFAVAGVNAVFITLAIRSFPGQAVEKPYFQGVHYSDALARKAAQETLRWTAEINKAARTSEGAAIELTFRSADGAPIYGLVVEATLERPAHAGADQRLLFAQRADGAYLATAPGVGAGVWDLKASATGADGARFDLVKRLLLR